MNLQDYIRIYVEKVGVEKATKNAMFTLTHMFMKDADINSFDPRTIYILVGRLKFSVAVLEYLHSDEDESHIECINHAKYMADAY